ncbi:MAG: DUF882 domain-containing protein [Alphaproteobacteria bacterium]|nr:DUF882 domain-containing protein [Alphaproteobacteria bacterium]
MDRFFNSTRRGFLGWGLLALSCGVSAPAFAKWAAVPPRPKAQGARVLSFHNLHTDERLRTAYWKDGVYDRGAWAQINHILRDHYSGETHIMSLGLMDLLHDLQTNLRSDRAIEVISGYRCPATNRHLREASGGVARNSYHMRGMAIDVRLDGTPLPSLHQTALTMRRGGVGYYPKSQFVHLDVGPVRRWG